MKTLLEYGLKLFLVCAIAIAGLIWIAALITRFWV